MEDLKRSIAERDGIDNSISSTGEPYPWGLSIHLEKTELDKLKLGQVSAGDEIMFSAKAIIKSIHESTSDDGEDHRSIHLQITHMDIPKTAEDVSDRLYKKE